jgi:glucose dehydrogenase
MRVRTRKLIGTAAMIVFLIVYCLIAMVIGNAALAKLSGLGQALYFIVAGLAWLPPAMLLVRWMQRPDEV